MIVSPWIRADVVDSVFVTNLETAAQRGVDVFIGYGLEAEEREYDRDKKAREELMRLASDYERIHVVRFGDTHAKVLVCDRTFAVTTSFNWLSFRGDGRRSFRDERGTYVSDPRLVDEQFAFYLPRFQGPA
jgi:phosphatidylserine/phosphatidylglycerophosphate/cardiolipin synthase-like enzyme